MDPSGPPTVDVLLEALKPVFKKDGTIDHFEPFSGDDHEKRSAKVKAELVKSKVCYRSPYIRLVVDERDRDAIPGNTQTLMIADTTDGKGGDADRVEILGQKVRASYERKKMSRQPQVRTAVAELEVGQDVKKVKVSAHILKSPSDGKAANTNEEIRCAHAAGSDLRQVYMQANMTVSIVASPAREVVAPANMLVVDNAEGRDAAGGGKIDVKVRRLARRSARRCRWSR